MKKIKPDSFSEFFRAVRITRENLDEILTILAEEKIDKVEISDGDYLYISLDEMRGKKGDVPAKLEIKGRSSQEWLSYVSVSFSSQLGGKLWLYVSGSNQENIFLKIKNIFNQSRSIKYYLFHPIFLTVVFWILFSNLFHPLLLKVLSTLMVSSLLWVPWSLGGFSSLSLAPKGEKKSFLQRNKDQIILIIISTLITALITIPTTIFFTKLQK